jgi:hypothetical protein
MMCLLTAQKSSADPTKYPQFAQQQLPKDVVPEFIYLRDLVHEAITNKWPLIIDVRTREEYEQSHIKGSVSIPLDQVSGRFNEIPKLGLVVFY